MMSPLAETSHFYYALTSVGVNTKINLIVIVLNSALSEY